MARLVVIGGVAAGMSAAAKARRTNPELEIIVYTEEEHISYGACGLPYYISGEIEQESRLIARTVEQFAAQQIRVYPRHRVDKLNPASQTIQVMCLETGEQTEVSFDSLVIATGASALIPPVPGRARPGVFKLRNVEDGMAIRRYLAEKNPRSGVIVGGGYIGLEMAETLHRHGLSVTVVEMAPQIVPNMDEDMAALVQQYLIDRGIQVLTQEKVLALVGEEGAANNNRPLGDQLRTTLDSGVSNVAVDLVQGKAALVQSKAADDSLTKPQEAGDVAFSPVRQVLTDRRELAAELVILAAGVIPNTRLAEAAGIELGVRQAIRVNNRMATSVPGIYAAGDCAVTTHLVTGEEVYIPMGTTANKQGRTAGENAAGGHAVFKGVVGTGIAKVLELEIARTGLTERECQLKNISYSTKTIRSKTRAGYYPGAANIHLKVIAEKPSGRLLGAQIVGYAGAGKRIDVFAAALTLGAKLEQLKDLDLAYAPPFSPVYDPILLAINQFF
jgi:NADPH-dependent 2,4-dienoyl-CoA reductase/sulfur reductase-like enzyme